MNKKDKAEELERELSDIAERIHLDGTFEIKDEKLIRFIEEKLKHDNAVNKEDKIEELVEDFMSDVSTDVEVVNDKMWRINPDDLRIYARNYFKKYGKRACYRCFQDEVDKNVYEDLDKKLRENF